MTRTKQRRGFAAMSEEMRRTLASRGGQAVQERGLGHQWDRDAAQAAGREGGRASGKARRRRAREEDAA